MAETQKKPFAFELVYEIPGEETLRNVLLTEDRALELRATNILIRDDETIVLNPVTSVTPDKYHFLLQLKTGLLAPGTITSPSSDWKVLRQENAALKTTDIYLGWSGAAKRLEAGETLSILLNGLFSASGARPTLPMLLSWPEPQTETETETETGASATALLFIESRFPGQPGEYETEAYLILQKMQWGGRTRIPLRLDTVGPHQVLNVDNQLSTLVLRLTHSAPPGSQEEDVVFNYSATQPTQSSSLQLELPVGTTANRPFALATADQANGITLAMTGFNPASGVTSPDGTQVIFKLTPTATKTLKPGEFLDLTLTNVVTGHPSGRVEVALAWVQVAGFRDGKLTCPLEKAPLIFGRTYAENIGIGGDATEDARVTIKTGSNAYNAYGLRHTNGTAVLGTKVSTHPLYPNKSGGGLGTSTNHFLHFFTNNSDPQVTLNTSGHLGIGTLTPAFPLAVKTASKAHGMSHTDGTATISTYIDTTDSDAGKRGCWLGAQSNHSLHFFTNGAPQVTLNTSGRLGIGTMTPAAPLDVNGNIVIQQGGKLGIGTTTPAAPLDVNGSIFIRGAKPFVLEAYDASPGEIYTGYSRSEWVACLMNVQVNAGKIMTGFEVAFTQTSVPGHQNNWKLFCAINEGGPAARLIATVLFIRREFVEDKT